MLFNIAMSTSSQEYSPISLDSVDEHIANLEKNNNQMEKRLLEEQDAGTGFSASKKADIELLVVLIHCFRKRIETCITDQEFNIKDSKYLENSIKPEKSN